MKKELEPAMEFFDCSQGEVGDDWCGLDDEGRKETQSRGSKSPQQQQDGQQESFSLCQEMKHLFGIAGPAVVVQFSMLFIFPQSASVVGRNLDTSSLAGFSLGSLVGNLTCMSVMTGALTAADTLLPRSFSTKRYSEMGIVAIRGFITCSLLLLVPCILGANTKLLDNTFQFLGQDPEASHLASQWIRLYLVGVPAMLVFRVVQSFLNAQQKVWPMVLASVIAAYVANPLFLKVFVPKMELDGSAIAISCTQWIMLGALALVMRFQKEAFHSETWPGISRRTLTKAIKRVPLIEFLMLSLGGVLSLSEWWFWETTCFAVGTLGVVPLVCHTIAYNLVPLLYMPCLGIVMGLAIRLGHIVVHDVRKAKTLAAWSMLFTTVFGGSVAAGLHSFRLQICKLFTNDEEVIRGCEMIWPKLCLYIFILHIFGINSAIIRALGMQWRMAAIIFVCLWCGALPGLWYYAIHRGGGLDVVWTVLPVSYGVMQILLIASYATVDWKSQGMINHAHDDHPDLPSSESDRLAPTEYQHLLFEPASPSYV